MPSPEEVQKAEGMMTPEEKLATGGRLQDKLVEERRMVWEENLKKIEAVGDSQIIRITNRFSGEITWTTSAGEFRKISKDKSSHAFEEYFQEPQKFVVSIETPEQLVAEKTQREEREKAEREEEVKEQEAEDAGLDSDEEES